MNWLIVVIASEDFRTAFTEIAYDVISFNAGGGTFQADPTQAPIGALMLVSILFPWNRCLISARNNRNSNRAIGP